MKGKKFRIKTKVPAGYMTLQQTAKYLQVSEMSIRRYIKLHGLPAEKPAGRYLINKADLESWIKEHE